MDPKNILLIPSWYPNENDPINGIFIRDQAEILSTKFNVTVLYPELLLWREAIKIRSIKKKVIQKRKDLTEIFIKGFCPPRLPYIFQLLILKYISLRQIHHLIKRFGKPDIIHAHVFIPAGWIACHAGIKYKIPVVMTEHTGPFSALLQTTLMRSIVRNTAQKVNKLIAVSPSLADDIKKFLSSQSIDIVGNVIQTEYFKCNNKNVTIRNKQNIKFLTVSYLSKAKGIHYLLQAVKLLVSRGFSNFEVIIGGSGPDKDHFEEISNNLSINQFVRFIGPLSRKEVRFWMQRSDVFVLPSLAETFSVIIGEAMSCGIPVIATRCGGPEFLVTAETGYLVNIRDTEDLSGHMAKFISGEAHFNSSKIRESLSLRFGQNIFLNKLNRIYDEILKC